MPGSKVVRSVSRVIMLAACVLPLFALWKCTDALKRYPREGSAEAALGLFGASFVAGAMVAVFALLGSERRAALLALAVNVAGLVANVAYFASNFSYTRGRQIRGLLGRVLPKRSDALVPTSLRARAARAWRQNGDTEVASVSAFSLLGLDLAELGAPLALLRAVHLDALDEVRHTELCYALARLFGDADVATAPMPTLATVRARRASLRSVAVESWVEGAYLEAVSSELARGLSAGATNPHVCEVLARIADDEATHAAHAWSVIEWCLRRDPVAVATSLRAAMARLPAPNPPGDELGSDGSLEEFGIPGRETQTRVATRVLRHAQHRLGLLLAASPVPVASRGQTNEKGGASAGRSTRP